MQSVPEFVPRLSKAQSFQPSTAFKGSSYGFHQQSHDFTPKIQVNVPQTMPEFKMNFDEGSMRRSNFVSQKTFNSPPVDDFKRR